MGQYRETLPENCPHSDAAEITGDLDVYRLVVSLPPTDSDFRSQRVLNPQKTFRVDECICCGLSVWMDIAEATNTKKLPRFKNQLICKIKLQNGAGKIKQTGQRIAHRTWWPYSGYDILCRCEKAQ
jgi:hypothetical protein